MATRYTHTQRAGVVILSAFGLVGVMLIVAAMSAPPAGRLVSALSFVILIVSVVLFSSLTIIVDDTTLTWHFGLRLLSKKVPLADVVAVEPIRTTIWNGWGIHLTHRGWLYNIDGRDAVTVTLRNGKRFMLGTDDVQGLRTAIEGRWRPDSP